MKVQPMRFDDDIHLSKKDAVALMFAALQVLMPVVLSFMALYCLGVYLLIKFWLGQ